MHPEGEDTVEGCNRSDNRGVCTNIQRTVRTVPTGHNVMSECRSLCPLTPLYSVLLDCQYRTVPASEASHGSMSFGTRDASGL